jgi:hypothetical protein
MLILQAENSSIIIKFIIVFKRRQLYKILKYKDITYFL